MKHIRILLMLILLFTVLTACGGGNDETPPNGGEPVVDVPATATPQPEPTDTPEPEPTEEPPTPTPEPSNAVTSLQDVQTAVIRIVAEGSFIDPEEGFLLNAAGSGSGFIIDESGIAVTNNHVVTGAALLRVYVSGEDEPRNAKILGVSECSDLAVIEIDGDDFPYLEWYDGDIDTGLDVYAAGYPLGDPEFTLTRGIVSKAKASGYTNWSAVESVIEHDATINPGNSGGPLVTQDGQVVAVNYASNPNYNQYFAIARNEALSILRQLEEGNDIDSVGVNGVAVSDGETFSGIWVSSVRSGSPADQAGLEGGDIILQMEGLSLATDGTMEDYCSILRTHGPEDVLSIQVLRFATEEVLEGQLNGDTLEVTSSFGSGSTPAPEDITYVTVYDDYDVLKMDVPDTWNDTNGAAWEVDGERVGAALSASPNLDDFYTTSFATPGVFFAASAKLAQQYTAEQYLNTLSSWTDYCVYDGRFNYDDGLYVGAYDSYSDCGSTGASITNLVVKPADNSHLAFVQVQTVTAADDLAQEQIWNSFIAYGDLAAAAPWTSGDIVYVTDFDAIGDWSAFTIPSGGDYLAENRGSVLYIEVPDTDSTAYAVQDSVSVGDVRIDAAVETVAGPNRNNVSLVCRYNDAGWYEFSMNSGGYWYIWKYSDSAGFEVLKEGASTQINLQKAENELTAVCQGNTLSLIINGTEVGSTTDTEFQSGGIGVSVTTFDIPGAGVEFDWVVVSVP
ncbi:MAG: trypsin-like peptidase domain-containing protein [Chloroflexota bacterium]